MNRQNVSLIVLILFGAFSIWVVTQVGYIGIFTYHLHSPAGWQVITDLVIACILVLTWMIPEAKASGRNPWPFVIMTLFLGSIGPLAYLATDRK
ncbi:MAG: hypothetical protein AAF197_10540 [Pseudomonadota bacterium]